MIGLYAFVRAIHDAIVLAHDSLMTSNVRVLDEFFREVPKDMEDESSEKTLVPKNVIVEYPIQNAAGEMQVAEVHVPLITLVPLSYSKIEKAYLSVDFEMDVIDGELQLNFTKQSSNGASSDDNQSRRNSLEITIAPHESSDGLKLLIEGYEAILKRQIP